MTLRRADGSTRVMRPRHLVFATGVSGIPIMPKLPGLEDFRGTVMHSGAYTNGTAWKGKRAIVLGTGNSGHDVAQDLHSSGATVTMIQRSPTHIVSVQEAQRVYSIYAEGIPTEDCDLLADRHALPGADPRLPDDDRDLQGDRPAAAGTAWRHAASGWMTASMAAASRCSICSAAAATTSTSAAPTSSPMARSGWCNMTMSTASSPRACG